MRRKKKLGLVALALLPIATCSLYLASPYHTYIIHTGSMGHTIPSGSAVVVDESERDPSPGQVITFLVGGEPVTHRYLGERSDGTIITKGDANRSEDPQRVPKQDIVGTVVAAPRYAGWMLVFLFRTTGGLSLILFALALWQAWNFPRTPEPITDEEPSAEPEPVTT